MPRRAALTRATSIGGLLLVLGLSGAAAQIPAAEYAARRGAGVVVALT